MAHSPKKLMLPEDLSRILCSFVEHGRFPELQRALELFIEDCVHHVRFPVQMDLARMFLQIAFEIASISAAEVALSSFIVASNQGRTAGRATTAFVREMIEAVREFLGR